MKLRCLLLALAAGPLAAAAQTAPAFTSTCQNYPGHKSDKQGFCETRDLTLRVPAGQTLTVSGGANGGIAVRGWDGPDVRVRATVQAWAPTEAAAQAQAKAIIISAADNSLQATAPSDSQWAVNYEIFVPRQQALALNTTNGGISLADLRADVHFHTTNGGVALVNLGGQVVGQTVNGGLVIQLGGSGWTGQGLDVSTTNGGIVWNVPAGYSAQLFTSTDAGPIQAPLPVSKAASSEHRELNAHLGSGGTSLRATTRNGGVVVRQGS